MKFVTEMLRNIDVDLFVAGQIRCCCLHHAIPGMINSEQRAPSVGVT